MPGYRPNERNQREDILKWRTIRYIHPVPFVCYADFECFLTPPTDDRPADVINHHIPSGFALYTGSQHEEHLTDILVYTGADVMDKPFDHMIEERHRISGIIRENIPMKPLTPDQMREYNELKGSPKCHGIFKQRNPKCRHHNHISAFF